MWGRLSTATLDEAVAHTMCEHCFSKLKNHMQLYMYY
jgi:hypothetical protein